MKWNEWCMKFFPYNHIKNYNMALYNHINDTMIAILIYSITIINVKNWNETLLCFFSACKHMNDCH